MEDFKKDIDSYTIILEEFNTSQSKMDRTSKQNTNKDIAALNNVLDQMELPDTYRENLSSKRSKIHILFKCRWNILKDMTKRYHMIGQKANLKKSRKSKSFQAFFSDHKRLKWETNLEEKTKKHSNSWTLNSMLLNNEWIKNETKEEIKKFLQTNENKL